MTTTTFQPQLDHWLVKVKGEERYYCHWGRTKSDRWVSYPYAMTDQKGAETAYHHVTAQRMTGADLPEVELVHVRCEVTNVAIAAPALPKKYILAERCRAPIVKHYRTVKRASGAIEAIKFAIMRHYDGSQRFAYYNPNWKASPEVRDALGDRVWTVSHGGLVISEADFTHLRLSLKDDAHYPEYILDLETL